MTTSEQHRALFESAFNKGTTHEATVDGATSRWVFLQHTSTWGVKTRGGQVELAGSLFPSDRGLPEGAFKVEVAACALESGKGGAKNAFVRVAFGPWAPVRWAVMEGQSRAGVKALDPSANTEQWVNTTKLRVEGGSMAVAQPGFLERLEQLALENHTDFEGVRAMGERGELPLVTLETTPVLQTLRLEERVAVAMQCAAGDAEFTVWGGYDENGTLTRLVVDFAVFG